MRDIRNRTDLTGGQRQHQLSELESAVLAAWDDVRSTVRTHDLTWRDAAYVVALSRIAEAKATRGLWP